VSYQIEPTLEARIDRSVKLSASSYFEEARTPSRSVLLKNIGDTAGGTPHARGRVRASKVESRCKTQSTFWPSTIKGVRMHGRGEPEFLKY